jgi:ubiquitin carboxyl-terminal hydrolase 9/24
MSQQAQYAQFFFQLADLGLALGHAHLRDAARNLLQLMPADTHTVEQLHQAFSVTPSPQPCEPNGDLPGSPTQSLQQSTTLPSPSQPPRCTVDDLFFSSSPSQVLYYLEVI